MALLGKYKQKYETSPSNIFKQHPIASTLTLGGVPLIGALGGGIAEMGRAMLSDTGDPMALVKGKTSQVAGDLAGYTTGQEGKPTRTNITETKPYQTDPALMPKPAQPMVKPAMNMPTEYNPNYDALKLYHGWPDDKKKEVKDDTKGGTAEGGMPSALPYDPRFEQGVNANYARATDAIDSRMKPAVGTMQGLLNEFRNYSPTGKSSIGAQTALNAIMGLTPQVAALQESGAKQVGALPLMQQGLEGMKQGALPMQQTQVKLFEEQLPSTLAEIAQRKQQGQHMAKQLEHLETQDLVAMMNALDKQTPQATLGEYSGAFDTLAKMREAYATAPEDQKPALLADIANLQNQIKMTTKIKGSTPTKPNTPALTR